MQEIKIYNNVESESVVIDIEGTIGVPEAWQFEEPQQRVATYEKFRKSLASIEELRAESVVVNIRSTGGDVNDALLIYDALVALNASITTRCWGYVASAATVIAQAASEGQREISANALYLIHNSSCSVEGSASELLKRVELLEKTDERLAELYARRSGGEVEAFRELMASEGGAGRWLSPDEVLKLGLADSLIESAEIEVVEEALSESLLAGALTNVKGVIKRIGAQIGVVEESCDDTVSRVNVTHGAEVEAKEVSAPVNALPKEQISQIEFKERQNELSQTIILRGEDPSLVEVVRTANQVAYENDARRMR